MWSRFKQLIPSSMVVLIVVAATPGTCLGQGVTGSPNVGVRAAEGDPVLVVLNHVKAEKRAQFEEFGAIFTENFQKLAESGRLSDTEMEAYRRFRYLTPRAANSDSTFTYIFLYDPFIANAKHTVGYYLSKTYTEEETAAYVRTFLDCLASPQELFIVRQTGDFFSPKK